MTMMKTKTRKTRMVGGMMMSKTHVHQDDIPGYNDNIRRYERVSGSVREDLSNCVV